MLAGTILPFLPGVYDPMNIPISTALQLFSVVSLVTLIPASFWFAHTIRNQKNLSDPFVEEKAIRYIRFYIWTVIPVILLVALFTAFGLSKLLGSSLIAGVILLSVFLLRGLTKMVSNRMPPVCVPTMLIFLPIVLLVMLFIIDTPLTDRSRSRAIDNSYELIEAIEAYKIRHGRYPTNLNAVWNDYSPGVTGIEKYYYSWIDSIYHIYFEQPRFLFDNFGTREFVVYSPGDQHLMISHVSWHLLLEPD